MKPVSLKIFSELSQEDRKAHFDNAIIVINKTEPESNSYKFDYSKLDASHQNNIYEIILKSISDFKKIREVSSSKEILNAIKESNSLLKENNSLSKSIIKLTTYFLGKIKLFEGILLKLDSNISSINYKVGDINTKIDVIDQKLDDINKSVNELSEKANDINNSIRALQSDFSKSINGRELSFSDITESNLAFSVNKLNYILFNGINKMDEKVKERILLATDAIITHSEVSEMLSKDGFSKIMQDYQRVEIEERVNKASLAIHQAIKNELKGDASRVLTAWEVKDIVNNIDLKYTDKNYESKIKQFASQQIHQFQARDLEQATSASLTREISSVQQGIKNKQDAMMYSGDLVSAVFATIDRGITNKIEVEKGLGNLISAEAVIGIIMKMGNHQKNSFVSKYFGVDVVKSMQVYESKEKSLEEIARYVSPSIAEFQKDLLKSGMDFHCEDAIRIKEAAFDKAEKVLEADKFGLPSQTEEDLKDAMTVMLKLSALSLDKASDYLSGNRGYGDLFRDRAQQYISDNTGLVDAIINDRGSKTMKYQLDRSISSYSLH